MSGSSPRVLGAVLAGGRSTRFGADKSAAPLGERTMVERAAEALTARCDEVVVVSSRPDAPRERFEVVPDLRPSRGPLVGIEAALARADRSGHEMVFVLACDLPLVDGETVAALVDAVGHRDAAAPARDGSPDFEPLAAVYKTACLPQVRRLLEEGRAAARALFESVDGVRVAVRSNVFLNVNTPEELATAVAALRTRAGIRHRR